MIYLDLEFTERGGGVAKAWEVTQETGASNP